MFTAEQVAADTFFEKRHAFLKKVCFSQYLSTICQKLSIYGTAYVPGRFPMKGIDPATKKDWQILLARRYPATQIEFEPTQNP